MQSQKSHSSKLFLLKNIFVVGAGFLISFFSLNFNMNEASALFTPILSASVDQTAASVNGNQVINSTNKTTEIPLNLTVNTNNKTGYTATLNSETDETALVNTDSTTNAKINSISSAGQLGDFSNNTWGVKVGGNTNFSPIPKLTTPMNVIQTPSKTNGNESNQLSIGMKLSDNLESGRYTNKLIFSILTNNYDHIAIMTEGPDFNEKLKALETSTNKIEHFKKSTVAPTASMNAVNIEDEESDYEIKLWLDPTDKTAYYYAEPEKVYLNADSRKMFYSEYDEQETKNIVEIDLSNFNTSQVTDMSIMFSGMRNLTTLDLSNFDTSKVTDMYGMFRDMSKLTTLNLSNFNTSKVTDMYAMFYNLSKLTTLNLSNFNTSKVTNMYAMFYNLSKLTTLDLSNFNTSKVTNMGLMFSGMSNLTALNLSSFDTSKVTDMGYMFYDASSLTTLDLSNFDTSKVTNMSYMFRGVSNLTTLDLSNFDTSKVTDMSHMFHGVSNLTTLDLSNFDTSKVTNMYAMFYNLSKLTTLDLSNFSTSKVTDMGYMFYDASSLTTLDISNFDTSKVTNMYAMFYNLSKLITLDLSNFSTSKVTKMSFMFSDMLNLTSLDISNFDTSNVTKMSSIFSLRDEDKLKDKLEKIYVNNDFNTSKLAEFSDMFRNRKKLRGGNGSYLADPYYADKTWLRVDRPGVQGYFTRKP